MSSIEKTFRKGEVIISQGRFSRSFYVIKKGHVEVVKEKGGREVLLSKLGPNDFFGEMSLLDTGLGTHSASVRALEDTTVIVMHKKDFQDFTSQLTPGMRKIIQILVSRLRNTSDMVDYKQEEADGQAEKGQVKEGKPSPREQVQSEGKGKKQEE